ncbi:hypothetical protein [Jiangella mangrovi]|uniref:Uncharacterized protein n=1 Tax=Jiangella mangrovi TaxID=1524084 RepID=A0A7W9GVG2_9ACTN|nr:hypothetical protein [Jiangella mangrovi]MBB5790775.1 hypothetical protein [Jiangella mangrovi]
MRAFSNIRVTVDLIHKSADVAELARLATAAGWALGLNPPTDKQGYAAVVERNSDVFLDTELSYLVLLQALANGRSPESVLSGIRKRLEDASIDLDEPFKGLPPAPDGGTN